MQIEIGEGAIELLAVAVVLAGLQLLLNARARKQEHVPPAADLHLFASPSPLVRAVFLRFEFLNLTFDSLAFPASGHSVDSKLPGGNSRMVFSANFVRENAAT